MALSNSSLLRPQTVLQQLLEEINFQRAKEMRQMLKDGKIKDGTKLFKHMNKSENRSAIRLENLFPPIIIPPTILFSLFSNFPNIFQYPICTSFANYLIGCKQMCF